MKKKKPARKGVKKPARQVTKVKAGAAIAAGKPAKRQPLPFISTGYWLLKSEPESYSIDALARDGKALWTGVRNYQARNFMTTSMKPGEKFIFYHSNAEPSAAVGIGRIERVNLPDVSALDASGEYYDAKASQDHPIWFCCEVAFEQKLKRPVPLAELRRTPALAKLRLLQPGQRLSILPLEPDEFALLVKLGNS